MLPGSPSQRLNFGSPLSERFPKTGGLEGAFSVEKSGFPQGNFALLPSENRVFGETLASPFPSETMARATHGIQEVRGSIPLSSTRTRRQSRLGNPVADAMGFCRFRGLGMVLGCAKSPAR